MVWTFGSWPEPQIPIHSLRHGRRVLGPLDSLCPPERRLSPMGWAVRPNMDLANRPDSAIIEPFVDEPIPFEGHALVAHLRSHFGFARRFGHGARLEHRSC